MTIYRLQSNVKCESAAKLGGELVRPTQDDPRLTRFDLAGFLFRLFDPELDNELVTYATTAFSTSSKTASLSVRLGVHDSNPTNPTNHSPNAIQIKKPRVIASF